MRGPERSAGFTDSTCKAFHKHVHTRYASRMYFADIPCRMSGSAHAQVLGFKVCNA